MAGKSKTKSTSKEAVNIHARNARRGQVIFSVFAIVLILSMLLSSVVYLK